MNKRRWAVAAGAAVAAVSVGGAVLFGSLAGAQPGPAEPKIGDVSLKLNSILDPSMAIQSWGSEAADVVSGPGEDPLLYDPGAVAAGDTVVQSIAVTSIDVNGETATANAVVSINGVANQEPASIPLVLENGDWKINRAFVCGLTTGPDGPTQPGC